MLDDETSAYLSGKNVLVTGGSGSIGSRIVKLLTGTECRSIRVLSNDEYGLFSLESNLHLKDDRLRLLLGDVRDRDRMNKACENIDVIFHTAALKHIPLCEYNPFEAVLTNVIGTQNVIEAGLKNDVDRFVLISTDKAVNPTSTLGATKLLSERLAVSAMHHKGSRRGVFYCVRFGNVIDSRGSVYETFLNQVTNGKSVTLTDKRMTRFIMTTTEACKLVLDTLTIAKGGEIFVLKMPAVKILDLANAIIELFGSNDRTITEIGIRQGEKIYEELINDAELQNTYDLGKLLVIVPPSLQNLYANHDRISKNEHMSNMIPLMSQKEIAVVLKQLDNIDRQRSAVDSTNDF